MLNIQNNYGLNSANKISFGSKVNDNYYKVDIPNNAGDVFISAEECLEAYNKGGMRIHVQNKNESEATSTKSNAFFANMLMKSNLDAEGNNLNLCKTLIDFTNQEIISEFTEIRKDNYGKSKEVERYKLADGSAIDKELYDNFRDIAIRRPAFWNGLTNRYFNKLNPTKINKINIDDYTILIGGKGTAIVTNAIDSKGNILAKRYRNGDGSVTDVLTTGDKEGIHYKQDGTVNNDCISAVHMFFD